MIGGRLGGSTRGGGRADSGGEDGRRGRCAFTFGFGFEFEFVLEFVTFASDELPAEFVLETRRFAKLRAEDKRKD